MIYDVCYDNIIWYFRIIDHFWLDINKDLNGPFIY